jgi:hypothetical protein
MLEDLLTRKMSGWKVTSNTRFTIFNHNNLSSFTPLIIGDYRNSLPPPLMYIADNRQSDPLPLLFELGFQKLTLSRSKYSAISDNVISLKNVRSKHFTLP